jgi:hypothetical protein
VSASTVAAASDIQKRYPTAALLDDKPNETRGRRNSDMRVPDEVGNPVASAPVQAIRLHDDGCSARIAARQISYVTAAIDTMLLH